MAALHEKYLWPLIGVVIFAVLAAFYIDDRRRLSQENTNTMTSQEANTDSSSSSNKSSADKVAKPMYASKDESKKSSTSSESTHAPHESKYTSNTSDSSIAGHEGFSGSINDYLAQISSKRNDELITAVKDHQGFTGSVEDYLSGEKPKQAVASQQPSKDSSQAGSMSMDEYLAKDEDKSDNSATQTGNGEQTPISQNESDPFHTKEHMGFHGSYEEYANKYN